MNATLEIGYLLKKFPRLSETFILGEILRQERLGTRVHVFSRREPDDEPRHPELQELKAEVEVLPGSSAIDPWKELFLGGADGAENIEAVARITREFGAFDHPKFGKLLAEALFLKRRTDELGLDHLHVHFATDSAVTAYMLKRLGGPTFSMTVHAKDIYRNTVRREVLGLLVRESEFTVTVCDANVQHLQQFLGADAENVRRLYNGIDLKRFAAERRSPAKAHILSIGRVVEKKGFDVLVDALALLEQRGIEFVATIVGDGDQADAVRAQVAQKGLQNKVQLTGALTADRVAELLGEATVFCLPCVIGADGNRDALPTVLLEALAAGVPIIATDVTGIPEILDQGNAGIIVPQRDPEATAKALEQMLELPEQGRALAEAGKLHARKTFDSNRIAAQLGEWFQSTRTVVAQ